MVLQFAMEYGKLAMDYIFFLKEDSLDNEWDEHRYLGEEGNSKACNLSYYLGGHQVMQYYTCGIQIGLGNICFHQE